MIYLRLGFFHQTGSSTFPFGMNPLKRLEQKPVEDYDKYQKNKDCCNYGSIQIDHLQSYTVNWGTL
jgi:hypothetical protein